MWFDLFHQVIISKRFPFHLPLTMRDFPFSCHHNNLSGFSSTVMLSATHKIAGISNSAFLISLQRRLLQCGELQGFVCVSVCCSPSDGGYTPRVLWGKTSNTPRINTLPFISYPVACSGCVGPSPPARHASECRGVKATWCIWWVAGWVGTHDKRVFSVSARWWQKYFDTFKSSWGDTNTSTLQWVRNLDKFE